MLKMYAADKMKVFLIFDIVKLEVTVQHPGYFGLPFAPLGGVKSQRVRNKTDNVKVSLVCHCRLWEV